MIDSRVWNVCNPDEITKLNRFWVKGVQLVPKGHIVAGFAFESFNGPKWTRVISIPLHKTKNFSSEWILIIFGPRLANNI